MLNRMLPELRRAVGALACVAAVLTVPMARAEDSAQSAKARLRAIYARSRTADTDGEFTRVINECDAALVGVAPSDATTSYGRKLQLWAMEGRGELRARRDQLDLAIEDFDAALQIDPQSPRALRLRGQCLAAIGRPDEALRDFDKAIKVRPGDADALIARGEVRTKLGRYQEACADFDEALQLKPSHVPAHIGRGHARRALGQWSGAVQDYSRALRVRPQDATLFTERGNAYAKLGRYTEAANDFRRAMRIDSAHGRAFQSAAWLMCTCPDARYRDPMLAMELAKRSIELGGKNDHRCLETLAAALANAGYYDEAKEVQERALNHAPKTALPRTTARLNLFAAGKPYRDGKTRRQ